MLLRSESETLSARVGRAVARQFDNFGGHGPPYGSGVALMQPDKKLDN